MWTTSTEEVKSVWKPLCENCHSENCFGVFLEGRRNMCHLHVISVRTVGSGTLRKYCIEEIWLASSWFEPAGQGLSVFSFLQQSNDLQIN